MGGWRTVVIANQCKLTYKNNYLIVRNKDVQMIHLNEIDVLIIETTQVSITSILLSELLNRKIKVIFCDERHNPKGEVVPYYGCHNTSKKIMQQLQWDSHIKGLVWRKIISQKILNQSKVLELFERENHHMLIEYSKDIEPGDTTNREGHSAKVYFNSLFGLDFTRDNNNNINAALDYGYSILLSNFNKEVVKNGYITQVGINHKNEFNYFNLACDFMEPFRPVIDCTVYKNKESELDREYKHRLINSLNEKVLMSGKEYYVSNAIELYVKSIVKALDARDTSKVLDVQLI